MSDRFPTAMDRARNPAHPFPGPSWPAPRLAVAVLAWSLVLPGALQGQSPGREPAAAELVPGARSLALGMASQVGSDDPDVAFTHPALVQGLRGIQGGYTRFGDAATGYSLAAATGWFGGGVAISVHSLEYGRPEGTGPGDRTGGLDDLFREAGTGEAVAETAATVTFGRTIGGIRVGVSGRLFSQRYGTERTAGQAVDVGVATDVGPLRLALSGRNLGRYARLPREVVLGAGGYGQPLGPLDVGAAAQLRYRDDGELEVGGGVEFGYWPVRGRTFVGRVGFRRIVEGEAAPVTFGGSFWGDSLVLDYAYQPMGDLDGIHRIGLGWR